MATIEQKRMTIQKHEAAFADMLSAEVIERPKLSVWMILIPIIFVSYFSQSKRYAQGRRDFAKNYLKSKQQALDLAFQSLKAGIDESQIDYGSLEIQEDIRPLQADVQKVLTRHFMDLLNAAGDDYDALVRSAYADQTAYLLFLNRLNKAENAVYAALGEKLPEEDTSIIVQKMGRESERLRREEAERIFPRNPGTVSN